MVITFSVIQEHKIYVNSLTSSNYIEGGNETHGNPVILFFSALIFIGVKYGYL